MKKARLIERVLAQEFVEASLNAKLHKDPEIRVQAQCKCKSLYICWSVLRRMFSVRKELEFIYDFFMEQSEWAERQFAEYALKNPDNHASLSTCWKTISDIHYGIVDGSIPKTK